MECPILESWEKYISFKDLPIEYLIAHWKECKYCQQTLEELRELYQKETNRDMINI